MSTPTNRQAEKERKPGAKPNLPAAKGQGTPIKRAPTTPQSARAGQKPAQKEVTRVEPDTKAVSVHEEKTKAAPAPKPRDPSVARRDERREQRRAEIQTRQQDRRRELQQAKRQKLGIRYSIVVAAVLFIGLVAFFSFEHEWLATGISAAAVLLIELAILAFMTIAAPKRSSYRPRSSGAPARSNAAGDDTQQAITPLQDATEEAPAQETTEGSN